MSQEACGCVKCACLSAAYVFVLSCPDPQEKLYEQAMAKAKALLAEHGLSMPTSSAATSASTTSQPGKLQRRPSTASLVVEVDDMVLRAAFSHVQLWRDLADDLLLVSRCACWPAAYLPR